MRRKKLKRIGATVTAVAVGIVAIGGALAVIDDYRWWASADELMAHEKKDNMKFVKIAEVSYSTAIKWEQAELDDTQFLLDQCDIKQNCTEAQIKRLKKRLHEKEEIIDELKQERRTMEESE